MTQYWGLVRDHIRGPADAKVTLVEYGDFECPYCGQAEPVVRALLANFGDLRYVWRHLPLTDVLAAPLGVPVPFAYWLRRASVGRSISGATKTA